MSPDINEQSRQKEQAKTIHNLIKQLEFKEDQPSIAKELYSLVSVSGLDKKEFDGLIELIFKDVTATKTKNILIMSLLPNGLYILPHEVIYLILSSIGTPEVYYKDGGKQKLKHLAKSNQQNLLEWLICSLHLFGPKVFKTLNRLLPILFNLLPFEFLRPFIANLIFITILNCNKSVKIDSIQLRSHTIYSLKPWHAQLVVELFLKFPLDNSLKSLLVFFKTINPNLDYNKFAPNNTEYDLNFISLADLRTFSYPDPRFLEKLNDIKIINGLRGEPRLKEVESIMHSNIKQYDDFSRSIKRRRRNISNRYNSEMADLDFLEFNGSLTSIAVSINDCNDCRTFINNLNNIRFININSLVSPSTNAPSSIANKFKVYFLVTQGLLANSNFSESITKLEYFIRLSILDDNLSFKDFQELFNKIERLMASSSGILTLKLMIDFLCYKFGTDLNNCTSNSEKHEIIKLRIKLLKYLPVINPSVFKDELLSNLLNEIDFKVLTESHKARKVEITSLLLKELSYLFSTWYSKIKNPNCNQETKFNFFKIINASIPMIYAFIIEKSLLTLEVKFSLLKLFKFIKTFDNNHFQEFLEPTAVFIPPPLIYNLLFTFNPLVISEVCGYIAYIKTYRYPETKKNLQTIQNTYVMDTLNFLWRDKAFYYYPSKESSNKSFLLPPEFLHKLGTLPAFSFSNLVSVTSVGNIFHNPSFSLIAAEIVWNFEDETEKLTQRHPGPLKETTATQLYRDPNSEWLGIPYDEVRLRVLRKLDRLGYKGLCDLLFTSLKTLMNKRNETAYDE